MSLKGTSTNIHTSNATGNILKSCLNIMVRTTKKSIHCIILRFFYVTMMHIRFELLVVSMNSVVALFKLFKFAKQFTTIVRREKNVVSLHISNLSKLWVGYQCFSYNAHSTKQKQNQ